MQSIMIGTLTLYEAFAYFFIYSFLGWVTEVAFHAVTQGKFVNRGFLNGPVCPIYGTGVVVILLILGEWVNKPWLVFLVGVILPTLIELITGWALEKFFHNKWWDYSSRKFNFKGYICLEFSLLWGFAVLLVIDVLHPAVVWFAGLFGEIAGTVLVCVFSAFMLADLVITVLQVLKLNRKLEEIDDVARAMRKGSDYIGQKVADVTLIVEKGAVTAKNAVSDYSERKKDERNKRREKAIDAIVEKMPKRLLKAFPQLASRTNPDSVPLAQEGMKRLKLSKKKKTENAEGAEIAVSDGSSEKSED